MYTHKRLICIYISVEPSRIILHRAFLMAFLHPEMSLPLLSVLGLHLDSAKNTDKQSHSISLH